MAKMIKVSNSGNSSQAVFIKGGSLTVKPGKSIETDKLLEMSDERIAHYKARGVTFADATKAKSAAKEKGKVDDGAAKAEAEKAKALADAEKAVADASGAVEAAGDDMVAKAAAEDDLKAAEAVLAGLKG